MFNTLIHYGTSLSFSFKSALSMIPITPNLFYFKIIDHNFKIKAFTKKIGEGTHSEIKLSFELAILVNLYLFKDEEPISICNNALKSSPLIWNDIHAKKRRFTFLPGKTNLFKKAKK